MAKRFENDIDAQAFVDNFRATDGTVTPSSPGEDKPKQEKVTRQAQKPTTVAKDFKKRFIDDIKYRLPETNWPTVKINARFANRINDLKLRCGSRGATLSTYINNVLEQHFNDCEEEIKQFIKQYPTEND